MNFSIFICGPLPICGNASGKLLRKHAPRPSRRLQAADTSRVRCCAFGGVHAVCGNFEIPMKKFSRLSAVAALELARAAEISIRPLAFLLASAFLHAGIFPAAAAPKPRNIVFILSDDHRWDFMSFMREAPKFLETPNLDRLAREGAHLRNAFVSTSLCSPSRASILTGQYMHHHRVVDNQRLEPAGIRFFPEHLRAAGYRTAFLGKWHMEIGRAHV